MPGISLLVDEGFETILFNFQELLIVSLLLQFIDFLKRLNVEHFVLIYTFFITMPLKNYFRKKRIPIN